MRISLPAGTNAKKIGLFTGAMILAIVLISTLIFALLFIRKELGLAISGAGASTSVPVQFDLQKAERLGIPSE